MPLVKRRSMFDTLYAVDYEYDELSDLVEVFREVFVCYIETHKLSSRIACYNTLVKHSVMIRYSKTTARIHRSQ